MEIDPRPSFPLLYVRHGTFLAAMFHGIGKSCKMKYYYGYTEDENDEIIRMYYHNTPNKYFQLSSSLYEKELVRDVTSFSVPAPLNPELFIEQTSS